MIELLAQVPALPQDARDAFVLMQKEDIQSVLVASLMMTAIQIVALGACAVWLVRTIIRITTRQATAANEIAEKFSKAMEQVNREREEAVLELRTAIETALRPIGDGLAELRALVTGAMREFIDVLRAAHESTVRALRRDKKDDDGEV